MGIRKTRRRTGIIKTAIFQSLLVKRRLTTVKLRLASHQFESVA
jgi:hypothetical protein